MPSVLSQNIETTLNNWIKSKFRKPLILRGARQVGKATAVRFNASLPSLQNIEVRTPVSGGETATAKYQCLSLPLYLADWLEPALDGVFS